MAAVLACGDGALLSHRSAAALWGLLPGGGARAEVTVIASGRRGPPGMTVHQVRRLHPEDHAVVEGIPITSVARTLLDLAEVVSLRRVENAFEAAERLRLFDLVALTRLTDRSAGRHGLKPVRHVMSSWGGWVEDTRSPLEGQFAEFCRDTGLPMPAFNTVVEGYVVDALWADARLVVELDSYGFHRSRSAFESDRERDAALQLAGYRVIRVTSRRLSREPEAVERTIRSLLGRQPLRHSPLS
jgi:hypothetical protein